MAEGAGTFRLDAVYAVRLYDGGLDSVATSHSVRY